MDDVISTDFVTDLEALPASPSRTSYLSFIRTGGDDAFRRDGGAEHITASCFVFSPDLAQVLLCFHRKGRFWVQFGGHVELDDESVAGAALREAREESGVTRLELLTDAIADLDRHDLTTGFGCAAHWDVGFVAIASVDLPLVVSDESDDVRWFSLDALPEHVPSGFAARVDRVLTTFGIAASEPG